MQVETGPPAGTDLREYLGILRQRKWSIALVTLVVIGTAVGLSLRAVPVYTSEARVLVLPTAPATSPFFFLATINMETEAGLVASNSVATLVATNLKTAETPARLLEDLDVSVEGTTEILDIAYTAGEPARAQRLTQGFADAYLQFRETQARSQIQTQVQDIERKIGRVSAEISSLQGQIEAPSTPP